MIVSNLGAFLQGELASFFSQDSYSSLSKRKRPTLLCVGEIHKSVTVRAEALFYCDCVSYCAEISLRWGGLILPIHSLGSSGRPFKSLVKKKKKHISHFCLHHSYPLLKLPLPGTGPVEYSTPVKDYFPPSPDPVLQQGDLGERPDWVRLRCGRENDPGAGAALP